MKLTKEKLNKIEYKSIKDFYEKFDRYDSLEDKMKFTTRYLLAHDAAKTYDYPLHTAIMFAKLKIAETINKTGEKDNLRANMFLSKPYDYLKEEAKILNEELENQDITKISLKNAVKDLSEDDLIGGKTRLERAEANRSFYVVEYNLAQLVGGAKEIDESFEATKPGFFSRLFRTSSRQYNDLKAAYKAFFDEKSNNHGNLGLLRQAARRYLAYKVPNWKEGEILSNEEFNSLSKTARARTQFSIKLIKAIDDALEYQKGYDNVVNDANAKNVSYSDIQLADEKANSLESLQSNQFQKKVVLDLDDKEDLDDSMEDDMVASQSMEISKQ